MVHFQDASSACGAVVGAVWFSSLAFLAKSGPAGGLDREGWEVVLVSRRGFMGGEVGVAGSVRRGREGRPRVSEDGRRIRPVDEEVKQYAEKRRCVAFRSDKSVSETQSIQVSHSSERTHQSMRSARARSRSQLQPR